MHRNTAASQWYNRRRLTSKSRAHTFDASLPSTEAPSSTLARSEARRRRIGQDCSFEGAARPVSVEGRPTLWLGESCPDAHAVRPQRPDPCSCCPPSPGGAAVPEGVGTAPLGWKTELGVRPGRPGEGQREASPSGERPARWFYCQTSASRRPCQALTDLVMRRASRLGHQTLEVLLRTGAVAGYCHLVAARP